MVKMQAARNKGIYKVPMTKITSKEIVDAEKDTPPAMPCIEKNDNRGEPQAIVTSVNANEDQSD